MKRKWNILFALLAAAALVLAAGCSDGSSDAWEDEVASLDSGADSNVAGGESGDGNASDAGGSGENSGGDDSSIVSSGDSGDGNASDAGSSSDNGGGDDSSIVSSGDSGDGNASDASGSGDGGDNGGSGESAGGGDAGGDAGNTGGNSGGGNASDASGSGDGGDNGGGGGSSNVDSGTGGDAGGDAGNTGGDSGGGDNSGGEDAAITLIEISSDNVEELLQSIGTVKGNDSTGCYWNFEEGTLDTGDEGYTFTVAWVDNNKSSSKKPATGATLSYIKDVGKVITSLLALDLSDAEWDQKPERESNGVATTGTVKARIELSEDASASHTIPESLQSVTIVLESDVNWTISS